MGIGVLVGVLLRIWEYSDLRDLYMDETALLTNLVGVPAFDFGHVLKQDQLAPPGFLVVERLLVRLPMDVAASGRLFPLACGLASMFLVVPLARKYVGGVGAPMAVWMLALADHLIYYSAEIKPYMCDLVGAMGTLLLAVPPEPEPPSRRRLLALAAWGVVTPWFSFPVVFVLAGVGLHLIWRSWTTGGTRAAARAVAVCGAWLVSFLGCFAISRSIVSKGDFLWTWWNFAFLPIPPRSWRDARFTAETIANVFINPASVLTPFGFIPTAILASALAVLGAFSLGRRWRGGLFVVLAPLAVHLAVSALRQYPFHGRLILSLVPTYHLLLAEGAAAVGRAWKPWAALVIALTFVGGQAGDLFWNQFVLPKSRYRPFDTHGDLKNDLLDELDYLRDPKTPPGVRPAEPSPAGPSGHSTPRSDEPPRLLVALRRDVPEEALDERPSPPAGEGRPRRGRMRGRPASDAEVGDGKNLWRPLNAPPSSGPAGHLPPRGGKGVEVSGLGSDGSWSRGDTGRLLPRVPKAAPQPVLDSGPGAHSS